MKFWHRSMVLLLALCAASPANAALQSPADFHAEIGKIYDFPIGKLSREEMVKKSAELDVFWKKVDAEKATYLPMLRKELTDASNPKFFAFDGATLLRSISDDRADGQLALDSISRTDPKNASGEGYVGTIHSFAVDGYDVRAAAMKFADSPDFFIYYGFHVMPMDQFNALIYMLFPMEEKVFAGDLAKRLEVESNPKTQLTLVKLVYLTVTPEGQAALTAFCGRKKRDSKVAKECKTKVDYKGHTHDASETEDAIRKRRREIASGSIGHSFWNNFHEASEALVFKVKSR
jgi:hypothetical protein